MRIHLGDDVRELDHRIGDTVYLRVRDEPTRGLVTAYYVCPSDLLYTVTWFDGHDTRHYGFELSAEFVPHYRPASTAEGEG